MSAAEIEELMRQIELGGRKAEVQVADDVGSQKLHMQVMQMKVERLQKLLVKPEGKMMGANPGNPGGAVVHHNPNAAPMYETKALSATHPILLYLGCFGLDRNIQVNKQCVFP